MRPLACRDCSFEFGEEHECLALENVVCCQLEVSAADQPLYIYLIMLLPESGISEYINQDSRFRLVIILFHARQFSQNIACDSSECYPFIFFSVFRVENS